MELGHLPLGAALVARLVGTLVPIPQDFHCVVVVLDHHEAGVCVGAVETVRVVLWRLFLPGVKCHGKAVLGLDLPVVKHPLEREVLEAEGSICIEEDDELVVLDVLGQGRGFDPGRVAVFEVVGADELVVVAVDQRVDVVAEDAAGHMVELAPVEDAVVEVCRRLQGAGFQIQNQNVPAHPAVVLCLLGQLQRRQVEVLVNEGEGGFVGGDLEGLVELTDDVDDANGSTVVGHGPVGSS